MRRRPPPSKTTKPQRRPYVALIGNPKIVVPLRGELDGLGINSSIKDSPAMLVDDVNEATRAVVIAPPVPDESVAQICVNLTQALPHLPIFAVLRSTLPWKSEKQLYDAGSMAVFLWPKEKRALIHTLIGLALIPRRVTDKEPRDAGLGKRTRARIKTAPELRDCRLDVRVIRGVVVLAGTVRGLWQVEVAESIARSVPGVQRVASDDIVVGSDGSSDRAIETTIRRLIRSLSDLDLRTLALKVEDGEVVLAGTVGSSLQLDRVCGLIRQLRGVKSLKTFVTVSADARMRDRTLAKKVEKALTVRYPKLRIGVSAFGNVAVLRGTVPLAETREEIAKLVAFQPGVERVVNKLTVRRSSQEKGQP